MIEFTEFNKTVKRISKMCQKYNCVFVTAQANHVGPHRFRYSHYNHIWSFNDNNPSNNARRANVHALSNM